MVFSNTLSFILSATVLVALITETQAHGTITSVTGANGVNSAGFGIIADTPRDGGLPIPFEQDTSIIRNAEIKSGKTGVCGRTKAGGNNDVASQLAAASDAGLPAASDSGELTMTLHQVNQDGAGPYTCDVSADGGNTFQPAQVTQNVPGLKGVSLSVAKDFPLVMQVAASTSCTGGPDGNACIARCRNPALAGPFGSCVAFTMGGSNSTTSDNSTASDNSTTSDSSTASSNSTTSDDSTVSNNSTDTSTDDNSADSSANNNSTDSNSSADDNSTENNSAATSADDSSTAGSTDDTAAEDNTTSAGASNASNGNAKTGKLGGVLAKVKAAKGAKKAAKGGKKAKARSPAKKRVINSRVAGANAGYWIEA